MNDRLDFISDFGNGRIAADLAKEFQSHGYEAWILFKPFDKYSDTLVNEGKQLDFRIGEALFDDCLYLLSIGKARRQSQDLAREL